MGGVGSLKYCIFSFQVVVPNTLPYLRILSIGHNCAIILKNRNFYVNSEPTLDGLFMAHHFRKVENPWLTLIN